MNKIQRNNVGLITVDKSIACIHMYKQSIYNTEVQQYIIGYTSDTAEDFKATCRK